MRNILKGAFLLILSFMIVGCSSTPNCSAVEAKDLVIEIAKDEIKNQGLGSIVNKLKYKVDSIRTTNYDKNRDFYECAATFNMIGNETKKLPITYTVESTDDGKNFYVNVFGLY